MRAPPPQPPPGLGSITGLRLIQNADAGGNVSSLDRNAYKSLQYYLLLLTPGVLGGVFAYVVYPPVDQGLLVSFGLCVLFLPMVLQLRSILRKRFTQDLPALRKAYISSSLVLALFAALLLLNGRLDTSPRTVVNTILVQKSVSRGRGGPEYTLTVSSSRPGTSLENFRVDSRTFARAAVGGTVTIELHKGYFGVPWSGRISPQ